MKVDALVLEPMEESLVKVVIDWQAPVGIWIRSASMCSCASSNPCHHHMSLASPTIRCNTMHDAGFCQQCTVHIFPNRSTLPIALVGKRLRHCFPPAAREADRAAAGTAASAAAQSEPRWTTSRTARAGGRRAGIAPGTTKFFAARRIATVAITSVGSVGLEQPKCCHTVPTQVP